MGRGIGGAVENMAAVATPATTRTATITAVASPLQNTLEQFQQLFYTMSGMSADDIAGLGEQDARDRVRGAALDKWEALSDYATQLSEKQKKDFGRGGRLMIAVNDLLEANELIHSSDMDEKLLAQTIADNSFRHIGRIMTTVEPNHPFTKAWSSLMNEYGQTQGIEQVQYLESKGLLSSEEAAFYKANAGSLYQEAYASGKSNPAWMGIQAMERAARTAENLQAAPSMGKQADGVVANALSDMNELVGHSKEYLADAKHQKGIWHVTRYAASKLTRAQAVLAATQDPAARAVNTVISSTEVVDRHRDIVSSYIKPQADPPVMALSNRLWLDQISNYQQYISRDSSGVIASHSRDFGILLSPESASRVVDAAKNGTVNEELLHEEFHTAQPDASKKKKCRDSLHELWEREVILEGCTQAQTLQGMRKHQDGWQDTDTRINGYSAITALVEDVVDDYVSRSGADKDQTLASLSSTVSGERLGNLSEILVGDKSVASQNKVLEHLDPVLYDWEAASDSAGNNPLFRSQIRSAIKALRS